MAQREGGWLGTQTADIPAALPAAPKAPSRVPLPCRRQPCLQPPATSCHVFSPPPPAAMFWAPHAGAGGSPGPCSRPHPPGRPGTRPAARRGRRGQPRVLRSAVLPLGPGWEGPCKRPRGWGGGVAARLHRGAPPHLELAADAAPGKGRGPAAARRPSARRRALCGAGADRWQANLRPAESSGLPARRSRAGWACVPRGPGKLPVTAGLSQDPPKTQAFLRGCGVVSGSGWRSRQA